MLITNRSVCTSARSLTHVAVWKSLRPFGWNRPFSTSRPTSPPLAGKSSPSILISKLDNIYQNLALESVLAKEVSLSAPVLLIWRNRPCVVIGRCQNPWAECKLDELKAHRVDLCRRLSGGGSVYHDAGTFIFSFLRPGVAVDKDQNNEILINSLKICKPDLKNISSESRNDITIGNKKISGSAFQVVNNASSLHHGTILLNTDMNALGRFLNPHPLKLQNKGVASVRARVANFVDYCPDITFEKMADALSKSFLSSFGLPTDKYSVQEIEEGDPLLTRSSWRQKVDSISDQKWTLGETPRFDSSFAHSFDWGIVELLFRVNNGIICGVDVFSDAVDVERIFHLRRCAGMLEGTPFTRDSDSKLFRMAEIIPKANNLTVE